MQEPQPVSVLTGEMLADLLTRNLSPTGEVRDKLLSIAERDIYAETVHALGYDPLAGKP